MSGSVAGHGDGASMGQDYRPGDGQSWTRASYPSAPRTIGPVEAVEDVGKVRGVDSDPVVDDDYRQPIVGLDLRLEYDAATGLGEPIQIGDQAA